MHVRYIKDKSSIIKYQPQKKSQTNVRKDTPLNHTQHKTMAYERYCYLQY